MDSVTVTSSSLQPHELTAPLQNLTGVFSHGSMGKLGRRHTMDSATMREAGGSQRGSSAGSRCW